MGVKLKQFARIPNVIIDELLKPLTPTQGIVLLIIARKTYGYNGFGEWMSQGEIAETAGISRSVVCRAVKVLVKNQVINIARDPKKHPNKMHYQINLGAIIAPGCKLNTPGVQAEHTGCIDKSTENALITDEPLCNNVLKTSFKDTIKRTSVIKTKNPRVVAAAAGEAPAVSLKTSEAEADTYEKEIRYLGRDPDADKPMGTRVFVRELQLYVREHHCLMPADYSFGSIWENKKQMGIAKTLGKMLCQISFPAAMFHVNEHSGLKNMEMAQILYWVKDYFRCNEGAA